MSLCANWKIEKHPPPSVRANRAPSPHEWQQTSLPFVHTLSLNERPAAAVQFFFLAARRNRAPLRAYSVCARFASLTNSVAEMINDAISDMGLRLSWLCF